MRDLTISCPHYVFALGTKSTFNAPDKHLILSCYHPVPIFSVKYKMPLVDYVQKTIQDKIRYRNNIEKEFAKCAQEYKLRKLTNDVESTTPNMKNYIESTVKDPAPYVQGTVKWNFNRGSLGLLENKNESFLVNVQTKKSMRLIELSPEMPLKVTRSLRNEETFANELMVYSNKFIGFRSKNAIRVANISKREQLEDDDEIEACDIYDYSHVDEIIASTFYNDQLIVIDSNDNLVQYDLKCKAANFRYQIPPKTSSHLCRLPFSISAVHEQNSRVNMKFTYTTAQEFGFIDHRSYVVNKMTSIPFDFAMKCEKIFNHRHSLINPNLTYIVSSHMLYCIDHRKFKQPLLQWAHQITDQPMMITSTLYNDNEVICVSSNSPGDLKVFNFDGNAFNYLPYKPLSIQNSFNKLCTEGHFVLSDIKERVYSSTTGIALKAEEGKFRMRLFTQNAAGDIFQSILGCHKKATGTTEKDLYDRFNNWDFSVANKNNANVFMSIEERLEREELVVDDIMRMNGLAKVLTCEKLQGFADDEVANMRTEIHPQWKVCIQKARAFEDVLAKEIMNIWDDIELEAIQPSFLAEALDRTDQVSETSNDRITNWLHAANNNDSIAIEEIDHDKPTSTQCDVMCKRIVTEDGAQFTVVEINKEEKKKMKKPRVAGF